MKKVIANLLATIFGWQKSYYYFDGKSVNIPPLGTRCIFYSDSLKVFFGKQSIKGTWQELPETQRLDKNYPRFILQTDFGHYMYAIETIYWKPI